jgi:hypothetical protein
LGALASAVDKKQPAGKFTSKETGGAKKIGTPKAVPIH